MYISYNLKLLDKEFKVIKLKSEEHKEESDDKSVVLEDEYVRRT